MEIKSILEEICEEKKEKGGIQQVYFVACGGSFGAFYTAGVFLKTEASQLHVGHYNSNEFVHQTPIALGENSLVVACSHGGDTPETVKATELAKSRGASVIALTYTPGSSLTDYADYTVDYKFRTDLDMDFARDKALQPLSIAVETLYAVEGYSHYAAYHKALGEIDGIVRAAQKQVQQRAQVFALNHKDDKFIYTLGSGSGYGAAYIQSICIFMEMQWINSSSIHSGEFFHGPFEITDHNIPFLIQLSEGPTRALDERALTFLRKYGKRIEVVDAKELGLSIIDESVVDYFNQTLFTCVYDVYNKELAEVRNHPLSVRRYMWKVEY